MKGPFFESTYNQDCLIPWGMWDANFCGITTYPEVFRATVTVSTIDNGSSNSLMIKPLQGQIL